MGRPFRVQPTTSMQHARELAREACDAGEIVAAMGGDGIVGAVAGELRDGKGLLAVLPGGRGNDFARKLGIPFDPVEAVALLRDRRRDARRPRRRRAATTYLGILSAGIDSDVSRIALETRLKLGTFVYTYGVLRAIVSWRPRRGSSRSTARRRPSTATPSRSATPASSAAGCTSRPTRASTTACSTSC